MAGKNSKNPSERKDRCNFQCHISYQEKNIHQTEKMKKVDVKKAVEIIKKGGVVIFPTDTVYGIGASIKSEEAVRRIYKIKKTPKSQSFPILVSKIGQVEQLANIPDSARILIKKFWPGALTIILNSTNNKQGLKSKLGFRM